MDKTFEQQYHQVEERHWWFRARREIILNLLADVDKTAAILDVGCSAGALIQYLHTKNFDHIYGIDASETAINLCHQKIIGNIFRMDARKLKWEDKKFDVIIASDVLEHIDEDQTALREWNRVLKTGGILIVFVPAFQFLWSSHDKINHHYRRYTKSALVKKLADSNFKICRSSYWNMFLFIPIIFIRCIQKITTHKTENKMGDVYLINPCLNTIFLYLLKFEHWLLKRINFYWGVSVFAVARKVDGP